LIEAIVSHKYKNRRAIERGQAMRASDVVCGTGGHRKDSRLVPSLAIPPVEGTVNGPKLAAELVRLTELARRSGS
jgi:hypothetical protein